MSTSNSNTPKRQHEEAFKKGGPALRTRSRMATTPGRVVPVVRTEDEDNWEVVEETSELNAISYVEMEDEDGWMVVDDLSKATENNKPGPSGGPEVWALKRQSLCSALPYFNSYQSGMYHKDGIPYGILVDQAASKRDVMLDQVVITTVGGGRVLDIFGNRSRIADQKESRALHCVRNAKDNHFPIVVIAGMDNPTAVVQMPAPYCVLDAFHVTDVWPERILSNNGDTIMQWVFRLEKIDLNKPSWWTEEGKMPAAFLPGQVSTEGQMCTSCSVPSKAIFKQGWACLNHLCSSYFKFGFTVDVDALEYSPAFLNERTVYNGASVPSIMPAPPSAPNGIDIFGTEMQFFKGIVCRDCGCCNVRKNWARWVCEREGCGFTHDGQILPIPIQYIQKENEEFSTRTFVDPIVKVGKQAAQVGGFVTDIYYLPDEAGKIIGSLTIMRANEAICSRPNGPNDMFTSLQNEDLQLERNPALRKGGKRQVLTKHFAKNWGARYKFGVQVASTGFEDAPDTILRATQRLRWAGQNAIKETVSSFKRNQDPGRTVLPGNFTEFNEMLSIGYFVDGMINYHDDGEKELGPTVATLSLGSPSVMSFRPKKRTSIEAAGGKRSGGDHTKSPVLRFILNHGDMVIMHGTQIHRLYEHEVAPKGKRRYALTCRYIRPEMMSDPEDRAAALVKGRMPERAQQLAYHGEEFETSLCHSPHGNISPATYELSERGGQMLDALRASVAQPNVSGDTNLAHFYASQIMSSVSFFAANPNAVQQIESAVVKQLVSAVIKALEEMSNLE